MAPRCRRFGPCPQPAPKAKPRPVNTLKKPRFRKASERLARPIFRAQRRPKWLVDQARQRMNLEPYSPRRMEAGKGQPNPRDILSVTAAFRITVTDLLSADDADA
jgi:hypothetical protein